MDAEVFATGQSKTIERAFLSLLLFGFSNGYPVVHESFELGESFLNFRYCPRAVDKLPFCGIELAFL